MLQSGCLYWQISLSLNKEFLLLLLKKDFIFRNVAAVERYKCVLPTNVILLPHP